MDYKDNSGILSTYVTNAQILHNEVSNVPYDGIDTGYGWGINDAGGSNDYVDRGYYNWNPLYTTPTTLKDNRVEGNLVHNTKARFADGGSIYNLSASPGTVVDKNYLFNISGVGLYLDEGSRSMTYENNVVQGGGAWVFTNAVQPAQQHERQRASRTTGTTPAGHLDTERGGAQQHSSSTTSRSPAPTGRPAPQT